VPLTKQQAIPLYVLLCTDSPFRRRLQAKASPDAATFLTDLQTLHGAMDTTITAPIDPGLAAVYGGVDATGNTVLNTDPQTIINAIPALSTRYGGGPCPAAAPVNEEQQVYDAIKGSVV